MRIVIITLLPLLLHAGAVLAQPAPASPKPAPAGKGPSAQEAKKTRADGIAECMRLWDAATHMSRQEWSRTCQRIQSRLENLKVNSVGANSKMEPKTKRGS